MARRRTSRPLRFTPWLPTTTWTARATRPAAAPRLHVASSRPSSARAALSSCARPSRRCCGRRGAWRAS
eukprot:3810888-Prymnesium_polylepis.1